MLDISHLTGKQQQLLQLLQVQSHISSLQAFCQQHQLDFNFVKGLLLEGTLDQYVQLTALTESSWILTSKGQGLDQIPGVALAEKLLAGITTVQQLQTELGEHFSLNYGALRKEGAVDMSSQADEKRVEVLHRDILIAFQQRQACFAAIRQAAAPPSQTAEIEWLAQQGLIVQQSVQDYALQIDPTIQTIVIKPMVTNLTSELLISEQWREVNLKPYNIHDHVPDIAYGRPTILTQCIQRIRAIFLNMGFDEMTGYLVESAFWNFDVLFTPQDHPAREVQDTFYLATPQTMPLPDAGLVQQVKQIHEQSYGGVWTEAEASKAILRAQTTTSTARKLYQRQGQDGKFFSIDKVFRNENVDRTHLAEFYQIEGVVIGELLSVRTLISYLTYFYQQLGFKDLKFKPTYNPYTEPSLEVYAYHAPSQQYLEVGNSGLFRPEMLEPLGCSQKSTIAWGLGLERIAMLLYNTEKLSDLVGADIELQAEGHRSTGVV